MRKAAAFVLGILLIFTMFLGSSLAAEPYGGDVKPHAVMLLDAATGQVLYEKNADERIYPASTTKIMTCILALEKGNLDDIVTVGKEGEWTEPGYSVMGLKEGQKISLRELIYGMMLISGNDAAATIAVHIGGSIEGFADMMNQKAQELGMTGSHFITPHGVDTEGHYVTARDMATLSLYAMKNEQFMQIVGSASYDFPSMNYKTEKQKQNTNKLLISSVPKGETSYYYEYATGIKTGSTDKAYRCLVASAEKDGMKLLCLIYGDETQHGSERWPLAKDLFEYGFNNYSTVDIQPLVDAVPLSAEVKGAAADDAQGGVLSLTPALSCSTLITMDKEHAQALADSGLTAQLWLNGGGLQAPIKAGDIVGTVSYENPDGETIATAQLIASRDVNVAAPEPSESAQTESPSAAPDKPMPSGSGETLIWYIAGGALILAGAVFAVGLIRAANRRKRRKKRNYARRAGTRSQRRQ